MFIVIQWKNDDLKVTKFKSLSEATKYVRCYTDNRIFSKTRLHDGSFIQTFDVYPKERYLLFD